MKLTKKMKGFVVAAFVVVTAAGCATTDYRGEGMTGSALAGAGLGYLAGGSDGAYIGAAVGGYLGNLGGRAIKKRYGYAERRLALAEKRNYVAAEAQNAYFRCVNNSYKLLNRQMAAVDALKAAQDRCHAQFMSNMPEPRTAAAGY